MDLLAGAGPSGRSQGRGHVVGATVTFANEALAFDLRSIMLGSLFWCWRRRQRQRRRCHDSMETQLPQSPAGNGTTEKAVGQQQQRQQQGKKLQW